MQDPDYDPHSAVTPLTPEEIAALDALLQRIDADEAMSLDGFDGYLTAFAIGPAALQALPTAQWLPLVWGGDSSDDSEGVAPFSSKRQRKNTVVMALRHRRQLSHLLHTQPDDWEPIFSIAERGADELADAREWCMGFLQAVDLMPGAWPVDWQDAALLPLLQLGGGLHDIEAVAVDLDDATTCDALSRQVPDAVLGLAQRVKDA